MVTILDLDRHSDDRGTLDVIEFNERPARTYFVRNWGLFSVRAYHGHPEEWRAVVCVTGSAKIGIAKMDNGRLVDPEFHILSYGDKKTLWIPKGYANGWKALEHNTVLCYYAPTHYKDRDDVIFPWDTFGERIWDNENR